MARLEINRSGEMDMFVRVVELGGFSPAPRASRMTPSAVSKLIARMEARLGARLLNRSTRQLQLTPESCAFYERAPRILADLEDAERAVGLGEQPVGRVRINTSTSYANHSEGLRHLALAGVGLTRLAAFTVRQDIAAGRLVPVLGHLDISDRETFHAVYVGHHRQRASEHATPPRPALLKTAPAGTDPPRFA